MKKYATYAAANSNHVGEIVFFYSTTLANAGNSYDGIAGTNSNGNGRLLITGNVTNSPVLLGSTAAFFTAVFNDNINAMQAAGCVTSPIDFNVSTAKLTDGSSFNLNIFCPSAPIATTDPASSVTTSGATLNATVDDNESTTTVLFSYGTTNAYGTDVAASTGSPIVAGTGSTSASKSISGLSCGTTYHYRVVASNHDATGNSVVTTNGSDQTFTTSSCGPTVTAISPVAGPTVGGTAVTITGTNLTGATAVTIGGAAATGVTVVNATTITATAPAGSAGARDVVVTTVGGTGTGTGLYTYVAAPTVTAISPAAGPTVGGTAVTITGTNLTGATAVTIGGAAATGVTVVNATTITATAPAGSAGARDVVVTTVGGTGTGTGLYTYVAAPTVTAISPAAGPTVGGTAVTITGTNLTGATAVTIGGAAATGVTVVNATTITATAPAGSAGARDVVVTTVGGTGTGTGLYTYVAAPTVTAISPAAGPTVGGTAVTITGTNLTGATAVTIGGAAATGVTVVNATTITATAPAGSAGARDVVVTTVGGTGTGTGLYTYVAAPTVTAISPAAGPTVGGTAVTITGTNLTGATAVTIGGAAATGVTVVNATTITATAPAGSAGARDVVVTTVGGTGTGTGLYTYVAAPTVTAISPAAGPTVGGTAVTITGTNLTGATAVTIGGAAATGVTVVNATTITATAPAGSAGARDVVVTTVGGTGTGTGLYTYVAAPTVTAISPAAGPTVGGTAVTITGTNLTGATAVTIGGAAATGVTVVNATTITATAPAGSAGARDVVVTTVGGTGTGTGLYTYVAAPTGPGGIPFLPEAPLVPGISAQPAVLNLDSGNGPAMVNCLVDAVRQILGGNPVYLGQAPSGVAKVLWNGSVLAFYPVNASSAGATNGEIRLNASNPLDVVTACGTLTLTPATANLGEIGAALNALGLTANINAQGVVTVFANGSVYVVRPDFVVTPGDTGGPGLKLGPDGLYYFVDSAGNRQVMRPAFLDPEALRSAVARMGGSMMIQIDGTALLSLGGAHSTLVPDMTLGGFVPEHVSETWWAEGIGRYRLRNTVSGFQATTQGLTQK